MSLSSKTNLSIECDTEISNNPDTIFLKIRCIISLLYTWVTFLKQLKSKPFFQTNIIMTCIISLKYIYMIFCKINYFHSPEKTLKSQRVAGFWLCQDGPCCGAENGHYTCTFTLAAKWKLTRVIYLCNICKSQYNILSNMYIFTHFFAKQDFYYGVPLKWHMRYMPFQGYVYITPAMQYMHCKCV